MHCNRVFTTGGNFLQSESGGVEKNCNAQRLKKQKKNFTGKN